MVPGSVILMDFIDKWMFKLTGRKIPVFQVEEVGENGFVKSLTLSKWVRRKNSLVKTWDNIGAEIRPHGEGLLSYTDEGGLTQPAYAEYKGKTCNLYIRPRNAPNHEQTIGNYATIDDITQALGLAPSMREKMIFLLIGVMMGWLFVAPMANGIMS